MILVYVMKYHILGIICLACGVLYSQPKIYPVHHYVVCELKCLYWSIVFEAGCVCAMLHEEHSHTKVDFLTCLPLIYLDGEDSCEFLLSEIPAFFHESAW